MKIGIIHPFVLAYDKLNPIQAVKQGIPGSEETLIQFTTELSRQGACVTVYTHVQEQMDVDGVLWKDLSTLKRETYYDIFISWSDLHEKIAPYINFLPASKIKCFRLVNQQAQESLRKILSIFPFALSQTNWLRSRYSDLHSLNSMILTNGINVNDLKLSQSPKIKNRIVYGSDYDRGLMHLLNLWPHIRQINTDCSLHIFYGWEIFDKKMNNMESSAREKMQLFKEQLNRLMDQEGVTNLGRIGHQKVNQELSQAEYWAYPCLFPENCSTLSLKAVSLDCLPIIIPSGGLRETVKYGIFTDASLWSDTLPNTQDQMNLLINQWAQLLCRTISSGYESHKHALQQESSKHRIKYSYPNVVAKFLNRMYQEVYS